MIPAHRQHHRRSSRRHRREKIAGESRERAMPATTNTTAAIAGARSRGNASGCRQTATHAEDQSVITKRPRVIELPNAKNMNMN